MVSAKDILAVTQKVTKTWKKTRTAEDRGNRSRRQRGYVYSDRVCCTYVVDQILPQAYRHASGDGKYPVSKRQLYYACREHFRKATDHELSYGYFSGTLLVQYLNRHETEADDWKITADPRGTLLLPHEHDAIPAGTLAIDDHLRKEVWHPDDIALNEVDLDLPTSWPRKSPKERYQAVVYIEKEGFSPLLKSAGIPNRYSLAILSCKGQSVVAARKFIDHVCHDEGVPLLVIHDCDKAGFEIAQRLTSVSDWARDQDRVTYEFENEIQWRDLGLKLADAQRYQLAEERVEFKGKFAKDSICTPEEMAYLRSGRRVELNAFTSPQFIAWIEEVLGNAGIRQGWVPPSTEVLEQAYRRALVIARLRSVLDLELQGAVEKGQAADCSGIRERLAQRARKSPATSWDQILYDLAVDDLNEA